MRRVGVLRGHPWEQLELPLHLRGRVLLSPANTGPLAVSRQVVILHGLAFLDAPWSYARAFGAYYRWLVPRLLRRVRRVIAVSEFTRGRILDAYGLPPEKVVVVYNGVDDSFRPRPPEEVREAREALGIPPGRYVLAVASLQPVKNLPRLLEAWRLLAGRLADDVTLVIAGAAGPRGIFAPGGLAGLPSRHPDAGAVSGLRGGTGLPAEALVLCGALRRAELAKVGAPPRGGSHSRGRLCHALPPRVHLTGAVAELLPALYTGAAALAFPSLYEGFGLPPLEAMACGTPVLASNRTALPEVVGDAGLLVNPEDPEAIADGILALVEDESLRRRLIEAGVARAKQFTWDAAADRTLDLLRSVAQG